MLPQATITSLPEAFRAVKDMGLYDETRWDGGYRAATRDALKRILEQRMRGGVDEHLEQMARRGAYDRRNGSYPRGLLTELGAIELAVPRTRAYSAARTLETYARRAPQVNAMILSCFTLGLSTRKVARALLPVLGEPVSPSCVSRVAATLDAAVEAFHRRPLTNGYRALLFDGVVLARKTGMGARRRPVLVVLGIRPDGKKEVIDFMQTPAESAAAWETFLRALYARGLTGAGVKLICVDGGKGLEAALPVVYPGIPVQRCWAHKSRNVLDKVKKKDREAVKRGLRAVWDAANLVQARAAARRFEARWEKAYPAAVACLRRDLDELLACYVFKEAAWRKTTRTTNAIERRFREVRRRTRPMGVFSDRTSVERILYAVFMNENRNQGSAAPFSLTQLS
jgi:transposase-like protein